MKHTHSYIICATPRSGSTLLCDLLADTGVAGRPNSYFMGEFLVEWANDFNVSAAEWDDKHKFNQAYLEAVLAHGAGGTPVFGVRLMWESVGNLSKRLESFYPKLPNDRTRFRSAFGSPLYLHLSRKDKVAQAVSLLKAEQTGLWHVASDGTERERLKPEQPPVYDARALSEKVAELEQHDAAWECWFARQEIQPLRIYYETLSTEPRAELATVLSALDLDPAIAGNAEPRTSVLSDKMSREWAMRFRSEMHL